MSLWASESAWPQNEDDMSLRMYVRSGRSGALRRNEPLLLRLLRSPIPRIGKSPFLVVQEEYYRYDPVLSLSGFPAPSICLGVARLLRRGQVASLSHVPKTFPTAGFHFTVLYETQPSAIDPLRRYSARELACGDDKLTRLTLSQVVASGYRSAILANVPPLPFLAQTHEPRASVRNASMFRQHLRTL